MFFCRLVFSFFLHCWSVFVSAGRARPAPTSLVTTLSIMEIQGTDTCSLKWITNLVKRCKFNTNYHFLKHTWIFFLNFNSSLRTIQLSQVWKVTVLWTLFSTSGLLYSLATDSMFFGSNILDHVVIINLPAHVKFSVTNIYIFIIQGMYRFQRSR